MATKPLLAGHGKLEELDFTFFISILFFFPKSRGLFVFLAGSKQVSEVSVMCLSSAGVWL